MADDRLPAHPDPGGRHLTPRQQQPGVAPPVHSPSELRFNQTASSREELWAQLSEPVRQRVRERAGDTIEWWAARYTDRISAVVFGTRALIVLDPTVNAAGRPATEMSTVALDETSFRSARVTGGPSSAAAPNLPPQTRAVQQKPSQPQLQPPPHQQPQQQPGHQQQHRSPIPPSGPSAPSPQQSQHHHVNAAMSGFLGQLPPRAQQLLQDPFATPAGRLRYDFYYYLIHSGGQGIGGGTLHVWCYLADNRTVTFCAGVGHGYREPGGPSSWDVTCWRAAVVAKPGA